MTGEKGRFDLAEAKGLNDVKEAGKALGRDLLGQNVSYRMDLSATEYVTRLYQTFLRTAPDSGLSGYVTQAATPSGRNTVLEEFLSKAAYNERSGALYREIYWLISDHLGTPRMIAERTGSLAGLKRNDYLPFGESANALGGRATTQGYAGESVRQGFTGYEEDSETGLHFAQARYLSSTQGRFISVDPLMASAATGEPQSWNRYVYVSNNPLNLTDPTGMLQKPPVVSTITADHVRSDSQTIDGADDAPPQEPVPLPVFDWNKLNDDERRILENSRLLITPDGDAEAGTSQTISGRELFDHLAQNNPDALAGFLNQTAQLNAITFDVNGQTRTALSFVQSVESFAPDRIIANADPQLKTLISQDSRFSGGQLGHKGHPDSWKDNRPLHGGLQLSFSKSGKSVDADTDLSNVAVKTINPVRKLKGVLGHLKEVSNNRGAAVTDPYAVYKILIDRKIKVNYSLKPNK